MSALKILTKTMNKVIFAFRCWPAFKTNRLFSCWQSLRASQNNEEHAHLIDQVFFALCSTSFKLMNTMFIFNRFFVFAKWQFLFRPQYHWERISNCLSRSSLHQYINNQQTIVNIKTTTVYCLFQRHPRTPSSCHTVVWIQLRTRNQKIG